MALEAQGPSALWTARIRRPCASVTSAARRRCPSRLWSWSAASRRRCLSASGIYKDLARYGLVTRHKRLIALATGSIHHLIGKMAPIEFDQQYLDRPVP